MTMRCIATLAGLFPAALFLAACATATIEDAVPAGALPQTAEGVPPAEAAEATAAERASGADPYPNLSATPAAAAPQFTEEQKSAETAQLRARRKALAQQGGGTNGAAGERDLRNIATDHGEAVLKEIEGR